MGSDEIRKATRSKADKGSDLTGGRADRNTIATHNLDLRKQGRHHETPASSSGATRPSELQRLRREAAEMGNNSMTADLDGELAALERMNAQGDPE